ncbi:MAG: hypothetical protein ACFFG0_33980 [Candidatus Thorarchaeota archaeon]
MEKLIRLNAKTAIILYLLIDTICVGGGMGVPIFCILLGFPLGWYIAKRIIVSTKNSHLINHRIFKLAFWTSAFTFLQMIIIWGIWGRMIPMLFNPMSDFKNFGMPLILFNPKASFIGWFILMIFISPFLQLLTTIFAAFMTLIIKNKNNLPPTGKNPL